MATKKNNDNRFAPKLKIKKGDKVVVIAGAYKDRDKVREVLQVFPEKNRAIVEEVNIRKKHRKPSQTEPGGIVDLAAPIHLSNLMVVDPKSGEPTRVGRRLNGDGKLERYSKKSGETI